MIIHYFYLGGAILCDAQGLDPFLEEYFMVGFHAKPVISLLCYLYGSAIMLLNQCRFITKRRKVRVREVITG